MQILSKELVIQSRGFLKVIDIIIINGGLARLIGGIVRDSLLEIYSKDVDIATNLNPTQIIDIFTKAGFKVIPTGIKFGTVTVLAAGESFEITSLRKDISSDGRHAEIEFTDDFAEDAMRRDFTINAISYDPIEHKIYDYFGGIDDLRSGKVKFIGDANTRIQEDYLRILRFFRFSIKFAKKIDPDGCAACVRNINGISRLSKERIKREFDNILQYQNTNNTNNASNAANTINILAVMMEEGVWPYIFNTKNFEPEILNKAYKIADLFNTSIALTTLYALIFSNEKDIDKKQLLALKFSRKEAQIIYDLVKLKKATNFDQLMILLSEKWLISDDETYLQFFIFAATVICNKNDILSLDNKLKQMLLRPIFPVRAEDVTKMGCSGKMIGTALKDMHNKWIESDFQMNKQQLLNYFTESNLSEK